MLNSLDPGQARRSVGPDLGPSCLQRLSADDTSRHRVKVSFYHEWMKLCAMSIKVPRQKQQ